MGHLGGNNQAHMDRKEHQFPVWVPGPRQCPQTVGAHASTTFSWSEETPPSTGLCEHKVRSLPSWATVLTEFSNSLALFTWTGAGQESLQRDKGRAGCWPRAGRRAPVPTCPRPPGQLRFRHYSSEFSPVSESFLPIPQDRISHLKWKQSGPKYEDTTDNFHRANTTKDTDSQ